MRRLVVLGVGGLTLVCALAVAMVGAMAASAADPANHGLSVTKGCASPTQIGAPYACTYSLRNNVDDAEDTLTVSGLTDTVHAEGGNVSSGNVFGSLRLVATVGTPSCPGATGTGTLADPWRSPGLTSCVLPFGSRINVLSFSFYTVQANDFNLPGHVLTDDVSISWNDLCNGLAWPRPPDTPVPGGGNCNPNPPAVGAASQSAITQLASTVTTQIHDAAHQVVTAVAAGSTVHDFVTVSGGAGNPIPTGSVTLDWFLDGLCTGTPAVTTAAGLPLVNGSLEATAFAFPVTATRAFKAHYLGDPANPVYAAADGACESVTVGVPHPGIDVNKTVRRGLSGSYVEGPISAHVGDVVDYQFALTNTGDVPLRVDVSDPTCGGAIFLGGDVNGNGRLDVFETWTYHCPRVIIAGDGDPLHNVVTVSGTDAEGTTVTSTDAADVDVLHPAIHVVKGANVTAALVGDTVTYTFTVTNTGDTPLANVNVSDPTCDAGTLSGPSGDTDGDGVLDLGETWTSACTHTVVSGDGNPLHNPVTVSGTDSLGATASDEDGIDVTVVQPYRIVGFLAPFPNTKWKTKQTVPIKIMITDANGVRISDAAAAALVSGTCRVTFAASGVQTQNATCMKYDRAMHQFVYNLKLGTQTGSETITVTISYPPTSLTTTKSDSSITIIK